MPDQRPARVKSMPELYNQSQCNKNVTDKKSKLELSERREDRVRMLRVVMTPEVNFVVDGRKDSMSGYGRLKMELNKSHRVTLDASA